MWLTEKDYLIPDAQANSLRFQDLSRIDAEGWYYPLHAHEWFEMIFCTKGSLNVTLHSTTFPFRKGHALLIKPNTFHSFTSDPSTDFRYYVLSVHYAPSNPTLQSFYESEIFLVDMQDKMQLVEGCFEIMFDLIHSGQAKESALFYSSCLQLTHLMDYGIRNHAVDFPFERNTITDQILTYINDHYNTEDISLKSLSDHFSISIPHISKLFKDAYTISPISYLIDYRISVAKLYLSKTSYDVNLIGELVGYKNVSHFSRLFSKRTGMSPLGYRFWHRNKYGVSQPCNEQSLIQNKMPARVSNPM